MACWCFGKGKEDRTDVSLLRNNDQTANVANVRASSANIRASYASQVCPEIPDNNHSIPESKDNESQNQTVKKEIKMLQKDKEIQKLKKEVDRNHKALREKDERLSVDAIEIQKLKKENESLLNRFSKMAGERLTDGNPNIADLSDENRPTKLAEQYSELYDNEWTNAFELLTKHGHTEENACTILVKALCVIYTKCKDKANTDMENMKEAMKNFLGNREPEPELIKPFKDQRKKQFQGHIKCLKKNLKHDIKEVLTEKKRRSHADMKAFLHKCIELCWLMVIQDPSIFMDVNITRYNEEYDGIRFKPYTKSGKYIDYIVWPPIYLHEGGGLLLKGIVQCKSKKSTQKSGHEIISQTTSAVSETVNRDDPQSSCNTDNIAENTLIKLRKRKGKRQNNEITSTTVEDFNSTDDWNDLTNSKLKLQKRNSGSETTRPALETCSESQTDNETTYF